MIRQAGPSANGEKRTALGGTRLQSLRALQRLIAPVGRVVRPRWFVTNVVALPPPGAEPSVPPGLCVRLGSPNDADLLAPLARGRESFAWRFARGDVVLIAEMDGQVVGCTWLTPAPVVFTDPGPPQAGGVVQLRACHPPRLSRAGTR